jgi:serine/threonine protein kinase
MFQFEIEDKNLYILPKNNNLKFINSKRSKTILYHKKIVSKDLYDKNRFRYIFKENINRGGSSIIYLAEDTITKENVVIKELQSENKIKFHREINILDICRTMPNIIKILDFFEKCDKFYIVFPYIECLSTRNILYSYDSDKIISFMKTCLLTLNNIHSNGIIHRDIKPSNILVKSPSEIYFIDFGISDFYLPFRKFSNKIGTKNFRSPEQIVKLKGFDYKIDIWAFGIIFAEAIFQKYPFIKPDEDSVIIEKIAKITGKTKFIQFLDKYNIDRNKYEFINDLNETGIIQELCRTNSYAKRFDLEKIEELLNGLLEIDPDKRLTADNALELDIFN